MLERLDIQNYAIIDQVSLKFSDGFTTVTGETGAGKSIILGALGLIMGKRADTKVLLNPEQKCVVEASFSDLTPQVITLLEESDLDISPTLIVRREILPAGKSRAFVNDTPTTLDVLQNLSGYLVDLHQQWDSLDIHDQWVQIDMLDAYSGNKTLASDYTNLFLNWKKEKNVLKNLEETQQKNIKESEFNTFLLEELEQIQPVRGEQKSLEDDLILFENAQKIQEVFSKIQHYILDHESSVAGMVGELVSDLNGIRKISETYSTLYERTRSVWEELKDIGREAGHHMDLGELNPQKAVEIKERLNLLYKVQKKHGVEDEENLFTIWEDLEKLSWGTQQLEEEIEQTKIKILGLEKDLVRMAKSLRENRKKHKPVLEEAVKVLLKQLKMEHAEFIINMEEENIFNSLGMDTVQWLFSANKGSTLQPIKAVASGGEISRLNLCIKSVLAHTMTLPTLIFDEIDVGVSGDVAHKMGDLLADLSKNHQIISITHSPQVAAKAKNQVFVFKDNSGEKTITKLRHLNSAERVYEIAVMLSSDPPSASAIDTARQLIESA